MSSKIKRRPQRPSPRYDSVQSTDDTFYHRFSKASISPKGNKWQVRGKSVKHKAEMSLDIKGK